MQVGELFADRYRIEDRLGQGGMGVVYLARDERLRRRVALKVMKPSVADDPSFRVRFDREASTAAGFEHPNVVTVFDYAEHDGVLYLVTRYIPGRDLRQELAACGRLGLGRTLAIVAQVAAGLDAAHRAGHVHRDIKPANILLGRDGFGREQALVGDFGLVQPHANSDGLTSAGLVLGTAAYVSPEQLRGEQASVRSDVYALACVTFECLTGEPPFRGATDVEVAQKHLTEPPGPLRTRLTDVPPEVASVVLRGLAKEPAHRTASAGAFAEDLATAARAAALEGSASGGPERDTKVLDLHGLRRPRPEPAPRRSSARRVLAVAGVVAVAFAGALVAGYLTAGDGTDGVAGPSSEPSAPAADDHAALADRLPAGVYADCEPHPEREGPGRPTAVRCSSATPGADELLVTQWTDAATMAAAFASSHGSKPDGKCGQYTGEPPSGIRSTWGDDAPLACYINSEDDAILLWQYPDEALQVVAVRRDRDARGLFDWWTEAVGVPLD